MYSSIEEPAVLPVNIVKIPCMHDVVASNRLEFLGALKGQSEGGFCSVVYLQS